METIPTSIERLIGKCQAFEKLRVYALTVELWGELFKCRELERLRWAFEPMVVHLIDNESDHESGSGRLVVPDGPASGTIVRLEGCGPPG